MDAQQYERALRDYLVTHSTPADELFESLRVETKERFPDRAGMQISPAQGAFMGLMTRLLQPKLAVEVGTFTGYSSLSVARALPEGSRLICCDVSDEFTAVARDYWKRAGVDDKVELILGPALETLRALPVEQPIDMAFIDADKTSYLAYYEELLGRMRSGGLIMVDNVLWSGRVFDDSDTETSTVALREFNEFVVADSRVEVAMLPLGDGVSMIRKL